MEYLDLSVVLGIEYVSVAVVKRVKLHPFSYYA